MVLKQGNLPAGTIVIDQKYSIGITEMDIQHARWIELIEKFRTVGSEHYMDSLGIDAAAEAIQGLLSYTKQHFASEEAYLSKHGYPELDSHRVKHQELESVLVKLANEIHESRASRTPLKLNLLVTIWLLEHIMKDDVVYAQFIKKKQQSA